MSSDGIRILVVDDDSAIREVMGEILGDEGYTVDLAGGGREALSLLDARADYVILLTDVNMPDMNGIDLVRQAKLLRPSIVPIVMTGYASLETARAAVKEGAYDYVLKPFNLREIRLALSNALERHELSSENARLRELTELFRISEAISTIHNRQRLVDFVLRAAMEQVGAERGSLMLVTEDGTALELVASSGLPEVSLGTCVPIGKSISGWVAQHGMALYARDIELDPEVADLSCGFDDASFISVPLERKPNGERASSGGEGRRVSAVLNVTGKKNGAFFTDSDLKILNIVANHASVALENVQLIRDLETAHLATLESMALVLEAKDPYTHGHSQRVRNYSVAAAQKMGMSSKDVETLRHGAMLHDVGKIGVPDTVLNKVERLSDGEWRQIRQHPVIGYEILEPVKFLTDEHLELVRSHHERLDGSGYPDGLRGENLNDLVRTLSVADIYDAMSSDRAYRRGIPGDQIMRELKRYAGSHIDARVSGVFVDMIASGEIGRYTAREPQACA